MVMRKNATDKKTPQLKFVVIIAAAVSVALIFTITPWTLVLTQVSEDVAVIKVTDYDCVDWRSILEKTIASCL